MIVILKYAPNFSSSIMERWHNQVLMSEINDKEALGWHWCDMSAVIWVLKQVMSLATQLFVQMLIQANSK